MSAAQARYSQPEMRNPLLLKSTAWFLLLFFPAAMSAAPAQGTVQAQGTVTVNGTPVPNTTAIFEGDQIQTAAASTAVISAQGLMVQLEPSTTAIFTAHTLDLGCGEAVVTTSVGTIVWLAGIAVMPAAQNITKVRVSQMNGAVKITALENWSVVNDGTIRQTLAPAQSVSFHRPRATCEIAVHTVPQATLGAGRALIPWLAGAIGMAVLAFCAPNSYCTEASPAEP